jgi:hypothetical protein
MLTLLLIVLVAFLLVGLIGGPRVYRGRRGDTTIIERD